MSLPTTIFFYEKYKVPVNESKTITKCLYSNQSFCFWPNVQIVWKSKPLTPFFEPFGPYQKTTVGRTVFPRHAWWTFDLVGSQFRPRIPSYILWPYNPPPFPPFTPFTHDLIRSRVRPSRANIASRTVPFSHIRTDDTQHRHRYNNNNNDAYNNNVLFIRVLRTYIYTKR